MRLARAARASNGHDARLAPKYLEVQDQHAEHEYVKEAPQEQGFLSHDTSTAATAAGQIYTGVFLLTEFAATGNIRVDIPVPGIPKIATENW